MTWPTTPINTTNLDAGSDQPALARADLLAMANAVNSVIGQGGTVSPAYIVYDNSLTTTNGNTFAAVSETPTVLSAGATAITVSTSNIVIPAGTWLFECPMSTVDQRSTGAVGVAEIQLFNTTDSLTVASETMTTFQSNPAANTVIEGFLPMNGLATFSTSVNVQVRAKSTLSSFNTGKSWSTQTGIGFYIKITKVA